MDNNNNNSPPVITTDDLLEIRKNPGEHNNNKKNNNNPKKMENNKNKDMNNNNNSLSLEEQIYSQYTTTSGPPAIAATTTTSSIPSLSGNNNNNNVNSNDTSISPNNIDPEIQRELELEKEALEKAIARAVPITGKLRSLLPYELELLNSNKLTNITHSGSTSIWLEALSYYPTNNNNNNNNDNTRTTNVYRPMGDKEVLYLLSNNQLPDTQPYQAIIEGPVGRAYSNKYLSGKKWTDTHPTTVVEFTCPFELIEKLKKMQMKVEDGAISMGLGNKAGKGLPLFNASLREGTTTFRIVKVKRRIIVKK